MRRLGQSIRPLLPDPKALGGGGRNIDREQLIAVLGALKRHLLLAYCVRLALIALIVAILVAISLRFSDLPLLLNSLYGAMAITFFGAIAALKQVSDEMTRVRLLLALSTEVSLETLTEIARRITEDR